VEGWERRIFFSVPKVFPSSSQRVLQVFPKTFPILFGQISTSMHINCSIPSFEGQSQYVTSRLFATGNKENSLTGRKWPTELVLHHFKFSFADIPLLRLGARK
jgi:hypothetical protein